MGRWELVPSPGALRTKRIGFPAIPQLPISLLRGPLPFHHVSFPTAWYGSLLLLLLESFLVTTGKGEESTGIQWIEVKDVAQHPTMHRTDPHK